MGAIVDPTTMEPLLKYGPPGLLALLCLYLWAALHQSNKQRESERAALIAEKEAAVTAERKRIADDMRARDRRIKTLIEQRDQLEARLDQERALRRAAEDGRAS